MSGMAEVLAAHPDWAFSLEHGAVLCTGCDWSQQVGNMDPAAEVFRTHQAEALSAAGFGPVKEAGAAGVRSIYDIWGAGGRRTVRMEEIQKADATILSGEWDNHIKWNMADIAKERARATAVRGEG